MTAWKADQSDEDLLDILERAAVQADQQEELALVYRERLSRSEGENRTILRKKLARLLASREETKSEAVTVWQEVLDENPEDGEAFTELEQAYLRASKSEELRALYIRQLDRSDSEVERLDRLKTLALLEEKIGDKESALSRYRSMLEFDAGNLQALSSLDKLLLESESWKELAEVLIRIRELAATEAMSADNGLRLAQLYWQYLHENEKAIDIYIDLLGLPDYRDRALESIEKVVELVPNTIAYANGVLEEQYQKGRDFSKLVALYEKRLVTLDEASLKAQELRLQIAEVLAGRLHREDKACEMLLSYLKHDPSLLEIWDRAFDLAEKTRAEQKLAEAYQFLLGDNSLETNLLCELAHRAGELHAVTLADRAGAEPFMRRALNVKADDDIAFEFLKDLYTESERWEELQALYRNRIAATEDSSTKVEYLLQLCFLFEELLGDTDAAIRAYRDVVEIRPQHRAARRSLEKLYRKTNRWRDLVDHVKCDLEEASGPDRVEILFDLANLHETHIGDNAAAVDYYSSILSISPNYVRSQEALHRLINDAEQRQRVAQILEPLYDEQGAWAELAKVLEVQLEDTDDAARSLDLLLRVGMLYETKMHDSERAFASFAKAVEMQPSATSAREHLRRLANKEAKKEAYAEVLEGVLSKVQGRHQLSAEILFELGDIWNHLDDEKAEEVYTRLLKLESDRMELALPSARALERIHRNAGQHDLVSQDLRMQVRFEQDELARISVLRRLAEHLERNAEDIEGAINAYRRCVDLDPGDIVSVDALIRLYERKGSWQQLIGILRMKEQNVSEVSEQKRLARYVGEIYEHKLADSESAVVAYNDVLDRFGFDLEVFRFLSSLYETTERWDDLLELIEMATESIDDQEDRIALLFESAQILRLKTKASERSLEYYTRILDVAPLHPDTLGALEEILNSDGDTQGQIAAAKLLIGPCEEKGNYVLLVRVLEVLGEKDDSNPRVQSLRRASSLCSQQLGNPVRAFDVLKKAFPFRPDDSEVTEMIDDLERLAEVTSRFDDFVGAIRDIIPDLYDDDLRVDITLRLAHHAEHSLGNSELAIEFFERVLKYRGDHRHSLDSLARLYVTSENHEQHLRIIDRQTELADSANERINLLLQQARVAEEKLHDDVRAIAAFERILAEGVSEAAYDGLERLYSRTERNQDLALHFERLLDVGYGNAAVVRYKLAKLCLHELEDPDRAIDQLREALLVDPQHDESVHLLESLMERSTFRPLVAEILEPVYLSRMDWDKLTQALEARLSEERDLESRKEMLRRLGKLYEEYLEDLDHALEVYARLFYEEPADREVWERLTRLARVLERWDRVADVLVGALEKSEEDNEDTARLCVFTGRILFEELGNLDKSAELYKRVLRIEPGDLYAFEALESIYNKAQNFEELVRIYPDWISQLDSDEGRAQLHLRKARILEQKLENPSQALEDYREVLFIVPDQSESLEACERLLTVLERWNDLAEFLERETEVLSNTHAIAKARLSLGVVLAERLNDSERAIDALEQVLSSGYLVSDAVRELERLVSDEINGGRAATLLEPIYREEAQWTKLVRVLEAQSERSEEPEVRAERLAEAAHVIEHKIGDIKSAFSFWRRVFVLQPMHQEVQGVVGRLASSLGDWDGLVEAYKEAIDASDDSMVQIQLLETMARVQDQKQGDPRAAIEAYERIFELDSEHMASLDALEALYTLVGSWQSLVDTLQRKVERTYDPPERSALFRRIGSVYEEQLEDREQAIGAYREAINEDETDLYALEALDHIFTSTQRLEDLSVVLRQRAEVEPDIERRVRFGKRLGHLAEVSLQDSHGAIDAYRRVLEDSPRDEEALSAIAKIYEKTEQWFELSEVLQRRIENAQGEEHKDAKVSLLQFVGEVREMHLEDFQEAFEAYKEALDIRPEAEKTQDALIRLLEMEECREEVLPLLEPVLERFGLWSKLRKVLEIKVAAMGEGPQRASELHRVAVIVEHHIGDKNDAFEVWGRATLADPGDVAAMEELERLAEEVSGWDKVVETFNSVVEATYETEVELRFLLRIAHVCRHKTRELDAAVQAVERALEVGGEDDKLLQDLLALHRKREDVEPIPGILERRIALVDEVDLRVLLLVELAEVRANEMQEPEEALGSLREALEIDPSNQAAQESLDALVKSAARSHNIALLEDASELLLDSLRKANQLEKLPAILELRIGSVEDVYSKGELLRQLCELFAEDLDQPQSAFATQKRLVKLEPGSESSWDDLEMLAKRADSYAELRGVVEEVLEQGRVDGALERDLRNRAVGWYMEMQDPSAAEGHLRSILSLEGDTNDACDRLLELLRVPSREKDLVSLLRERAAAEFDEMESRRYLFEAAKVADERLEDTNTAELCYRTVLERSPEDIDALDALLQLMERQERFDELAALLDRRIDVETLPEERISLRLRQAKVFLERTQNRGEATKTLQAALDDDPTCQAALDLLEVLYTEDKAFDALRDLYERKLDLAETTEEQIAIRVRLARLNDTELGRRRDALDQLYEILDISPDHPEALKELQRLLELDEKWEEVADLTRRRVDRAADLGNEDEEVALLLYLAELQREKVQSEDDAYDSLRRIIDRNPEHCQALRLLVDVSKNLDRNDEVFEMLERLTEVGNESDAVWSVGQALPIVEQEPDYEEQFKPILWRATERFPEREDLRAKLEEILEATEDYEELARLLRDSVQKLEDVSAKLPYLARLATLYRDALQDPRGAVTYLEQAAQIDPENRAHLLPLCDVYMEVGEEDCAVDILRKIIESFGGRRSKEVAAFHHRLGKALESSGNSQEALEHYTQAFRIDLTNVEVLRDLGNLYYQTGDFPQAQKTFRALLLQRLEPEFGITKADIYYYLGDIAVKEGDQVKARSMLERALNEDREHESAKSLLASL